MTTQETPVPHQEQWELETPFGKATVSDTRSLDHTLCATVTFHKPVINRKHYDDVTVYLQRQTHARMWWNVRPSYFSPLTDNASAKVREFLDGMSDKFDVYRAPLPDEEIRERKLHSLRLALASDLSGIMNRQALTLEDLAIVLREALEATEAGKAYRP